ncbi:hypothetical protein [Pseudovibrio sp. Ad26]|nr:hypothetical protein [Pseudovibrio sp. Ad26]
MLQLKVGDVDLQKLTITIARRPDDPEDPRKREPNACLSATPYGQIDRFE